MTQSNDGPSFTEIEQIDRISTDGFWNEYVRPQKPVVITGMMDKWPAMQKWSFDYLAGLESNQTVVLEFGNVMQVETQFEEIAFSEYVRRIMKQTDRDVEGRTGYLSVFDLFKAFPEFKDDVDFSLLTDRTVKNFFFGWVGPEGTVTGFHRDWANNLLAQICGNKELRLVSPKYSRQMYPSGKFDIGSMLSQVDTENFDPEKFPLFQEVEEHHTILNPGEMLFTPRGWWHHVRSLSKSISVNCFGLSVAGYIYDGGREKLKEFLHNRGLYANGNCTCCMMKDGKRVKRSF